MDTKQEFIDRTKQVQLMLARDKPDYFATTNHLLRLRELSDAKGAEIPMEVFTDLGPEIRMMMFDVWLGLIAESIGGVHPGG